MFDPKPAPAPAAPSTAQDAGQTTEQLAAAKAEQEAARLAAEEAAAKAEADRVAVAKAVEEAAAQKAQQEAEAAAKAAEEAAANPLAEIDRQLAWVSAYDAGECVHFSPLASTDGKASIEGFGMRVEPFAEMVNDFKLEFGTEPNIGVRLINDTQCPVLDFMNGLSENRGVTPSLILDNTSDVLKSGRGLGRAGGFAVFGEWGRWGDKFEALAFARLGWHVGL